ncbi:DUF4170 domain-containing protein [uncultured Sneathiella sp.]|uniref:DUF4170 domain-containing protein n=1 Tax=uncultured Sneathiella sp. TaxID=879315 RepID=UPI0030EE6A97|tara:strand:- start:44092 stop:44307 length:216 start_codon:yes stop_codon:yes gene_type:complete
MAEANSKSAKELFVVFGGRVTDTRGRDFADPGKLDVRGFFENYDSALSAWRAASQSQVDDAFTKYVIVRLW